MRVREESNVRGGEEKEVDKTKEGDKEKVRGKGERRERKRGSMERQC